MGVALIVSCVDELTTVQDSVSGTEIFVSFNFTRSLIVSAAVSDVSSVDVLTIVEDGGLETDGGILLEDKSSGVSPSKGKVGIS